MEELLCLCYKLEAVCAPGTVDTGTGTTLLRCGGWLPFFSKVRLFCVCVHSECRVFSVPVSCLCASGPTDVLVFAGSKILFCVQYLLGILLATELILLWLFCKCIMVFWFT